MQARCTTASTSSVVIPGRMCDAAVSRTSRASCETSGMRLAPCPQKRGIHLPYKLFSSFPALLDSICEEVARHASSPKQESLESVSVRWDVIRKNGRRTIFGIIRPRYMIGYNSCGRERIYRAQKAGEAKVGEGVECAVCGEGQTTTAMVEAKKHTVRNRRAV